MVTNKLTFAVFALVVLFPIYFDAIFLYTVTEAGWTFDFYSYLHFSILSKFNLLFFSILFDTPPNSVALNKLIHEIPHLSQQHYSCKERIINIISSEIQNISPNLIFQQHLEELTKLLIKTDSYNIIENKKLVEIAKKLKAIIIQNQGLSNDENYRYRH